MRKFVPIVLLAVLLPSCSFAAGRIKIDQAKVIASGGFPYQIKASGSYYLASDLTSATSAIEITAANVTLDLNGFTISCTACGINSFSINGIYSTGSSTRILNGSVLGFATGILFDNDLGLVDHVALLGNSVGVQQNSASLSVTNSPITGNGNTSHGIVSGSSGFVTVNNCQVFGNGGDGISVFSDGLITASSVVGNGVAGIVVEAAGIHVTITNNVLQGNGGPDIDVITGHAGYGLNTLGSASGGTSMKNNVCTSSLC